MPFSYKLDLPSSISGLRMTHQGVLNPRQQWENQLNSNHSFAFRGVSNRVCGTAWRHGDAHRDAWRAELHCLCWSTHRGMQVVLAASRAKPRLESARERVSSDQHKRLYRAVSPSDQWHGGSVDLPRETDSLLHIWNEQVCNSHGQSRWFNKRAIWEQRIKQICSRVVLRATLEFITLLA